MTISLAEQDVQTWDSVVDQSVGQHGEDLLLELLVDDNLIDIQMGSGYCSCS